MVVTIENIKANLAKLVELEVETQSDLDDRCDFIVRNHLPMTDEGIKLSLYHAQLLDCVEYFSALVDRLSGKKL